MIAMQRQGTAIMQKIAVAQQRVTEARTVLAEAAKQRKVMEKLNSTIAPYRAALGTYEQALINVGDVAAAGP
jgi:t-SNARE complex subunit (syntaxin)